MDIHFSMRILKLYKVIKDIFSLKGKSLENYFIYFCIILFFYGYLFILKNANCKK